MLRNIKKKTNAKFGSDKRAQFRFFSGAVSLHNSACRKTKFRHVSQRRSRGAQFRFYSGAVSLHSSHSQENEISPRFSTPKQTGAIPFFTRGQCCYTAPARKKTKFRLVSQRRSRRAQFRFFRGRCRYPNIHYGKQKCFGKNSEAFNAFYIYIWKIKSSLFLLKMKIPTISVPNAQTDAYRRSFQLIG